MLHSRRAVSPLQTGGTLLWLLPEGRGGDNVVTYDGLFQYTLVLATVIGVVIAAMNNKKK